MALKKLNLSWNRIKSSCLTYKKFYGILIAMVENRVDTKPGKHRLIPRAIRERWEDLRADWKNPNPYYRERIRSRIMNTAIGVSVLGGLAGGLTALVIVAGDYKDYPIPVAVPQTAPATLEQVSRYNFLVSLRGETPVTGEQWAGIFDLLRTHSGLTTCLWNLTPLDSSSDGSPSKFLANCGLR